MWNSIGFYTNLPPACWRGGVCFFEVVANGPLIGFVGLVMLDTLGIDFVRVRTPFAEMDANMCSSHAADTHVTRF